MSPFDGYDGFTEHPLAEQDPPRDLRQEAEDAMHDEQEAEIDHEDPGCQCNPGSLYSPGSVESIKAGDTDPYCTVHGVDEVTSGRYASWTPAQRMEFDRRLSAGLRGA